MGKEMALLFADITKFSLKFLFHIQSPSVIKFQWVLLAINPVLIAAILPDRFCLTLYIELDHY